MLVGNLGIGMSYGWWMNKHTRHHANPNHEDHDPDVGAGHPGLVAEQARAAKGLAQLIGRHQACCSSRCSRWKASTCTWPASGRFRPKIEAPRGSKASCCTCTLVVYLRRAVRCCCRRARRSRSSPCTRRSSACTWA